MEICIDRDAPYRGLSADVVQRIANIYQTSFTRVLAPEFSVANQPRPGVATCRFAITGVGERKFTEGQPITWAEAEPVPASWAQDFKARLLALQGR